MDIILIGCCIRFSCTLLKWCLQLANITPSPPTLYHIPSSPTGWMNWLINKVHISMNWLQIFLCQYIHVYPISIRKTILISIFSDHTKCLIKFSKGLISILWKVVDNFSQIKYSSLFYLYNYLSVYLSIELSNSMRNIFLLLIQVAQFEF